MSSDKAEFKRQIEAQTVQYLAAFKRRDVQALMQLYTDDVIALYPGTSLIEGRTALAKGYQSLLDAGVEISGLTTHKHECDGDVGFALQIAHTNWGDVPALLTFRRGSDGSWLTSGEAVPGAPTG